MPKFSVIISVYNKSKHLKKTIASIVDQSFNDFEIIIVNDGSTDESELVIKSFLDHRIKYYYQKNQGAAAGRNTALKKATGELMAFIDADDLWKSFHLEEINTLIEKFPEHKVFSTAIEKEEPAGTFPVKYDIPNKNHQSLDFFENSLAYPILCSQSAVIHKSVVDKVGYFDENIVSGQDTDYWIRIGLDYQIAFSKKITATHIYVKDSLSKSKFNYKNKSDLRKFDELAKSNKNLAKYIAYNRFSLWVRCILVNDIKNAQTLKQKINKHLLNKNQKFIFGLKNWQVKQMFSLKENLKKIGLRPKLFKR